MEKASSQDMKKRIARIRTDLLCFVFMLLNMVLFTETSGWRDHAIYFFMFLAYSPFVWWTTKASMMDRAITKCLISDRMRYHPPLLLWLMVYLLTFVVWLPFVAVVYGVGLLPHDGLLSMAGNQSLFIFLIVSGYVVFILPSFRIE